MTRVRRIAGEQLGINPDSLRKRVRPACVLLLAEALDEVLVKVHRESMGVYGVGKMWKATNRALPGQRVARCTIERRMKVLGLAGIATRRWGHASDTSSA